MTDGMVWGARAFLSAALAAIAWADWRARRVPLGLSVPLLGVGLGAMAARGNGGAVSATAVVLFLSEAWAAGRYGPVARLLLGALGTAAAWVLSDPSPTLAVTLVGVYLTWALFEGHVVGGGDALVFIGLLGWFPDLRFVAVTLAVVIVTGLALLARERGGAVGMQQAFVLAYTRTRNAVLPTEAEMLRRGQPVAFMLSLAGVVYAWGVWPG